jgi:2-methylisocitrate lyase-like PEP mutase family enzyme
MTSEWEDTSVEKLSRLIKGPDLIVAPCALNPIMAQMAALAGFKAAYLSGGSLGWYKGVTEAGLSLTEMIQVVVDIRTVTPIPVVLDAGGGWGDPCRRRPASSASRSRTRSCRGGSSTMSAWTAWCRSGLPPTESGRPSPPAPVRTR